MVFDRVPSARARLVDDPDVGTMLVGADSSYKQCLETTLAYEAECYGKTARDDENDRTCILRWWRSSGTWSGAPNAVAAAANVQMPDLH